MKHKLNNADFILDEIESIELIGEEDTIDISVEDTEMFFCNDIYTHNSSTAVEIVKTENMGGSLKKAQVAHFIMSIGKTLEQKEHKIATIAIIKNRMGDDGQVFANCKFDNGLLEIDTGNRMSENGFEVDSKQARKDKNNQIYRNTLLSKGIVYDK